MIVSIYVLPVLNWVKNLDTCYTGGSLGPNAGLDDVEEKNSHEIGLENAEWIHSIRNEIKKWGFIIICINFIVS